ncbi:MAG: DUF2326 domain-containing protein, partial [Acidobacteriia bacterium]|nr:DUF2326 domain-containing protein [Terriglobia bacterium]
FSQSAEGVVASLQGGSPFVEKVSNPTLSRAGSRTAPQPSTMDGTPSTHRLQATWDIQVHNAFLLGLAWEDASDWQQLKDRKKLLDDLKNAAQSGVIQDVFGSRGQLEAERVRLKEVVSRTSADLKAFRVHSSYASIERQADELTNAIKQLSNGNTVDLKLLELYRSKMQEEVKAYAIGVEGVYESAKVVFPDAVRKHLSEVEQFHSVIVEHRRQFLLTEIDRLETEIAQRNARLAEITSEHARLLQVLDTYGALEQFTKMQEAHAADVAKLRDIETRLRNIREFEEGLNNLKIELAMLEKRARANYEARQTEREAAVALFNENSQALYRAPGRLMIDVGETGFSFNVQIERKGSTGISNMEIFCYDLMLAQRWNQRDPKPGFLLHDNNIFADVDDRQIALAIELAESKSRMCGFQYICTFNTDKLPVTEFSPGFSVDKFTRLRLTDKDETGGLLGRRLSSDVPRQRKKKPEQPRAKTAS